MSLDKENQIAERASHEGTTIEERVLDLVAEALGVSTTGRNASMKIINRHAVVITAKKPYFDWAASIDEEAPDDAAMLSEAAPSVYLIEPDETPDGEPILSEPTARRIFESELASWHGDDADWPQDRNIDTFRTWFDVQVQGMVIDLEDQALDLEHQ